MNDALSSQPKTTEPERSAGMRGAVRARLGWTNIRGLTNNRSVLAILDQMVVSGTSLLTTIIVGRYCGSEGLGLFALAMSAVIFAIGAQTTLVSTPYTVFRSRHGDRMTPAVHAGGAIAGALLLALILTVIAMVAAIAISLAEYAWPVKMLAWALVFTIPLTLARDFARRFDFARFDMRSALLVDVGVSALQVTLLVTFALQEQLSSSTAIVLIGASCASLVALWFARRRKEFAIDRGKIGWLIKHDWNFGRWLLADHMICVAQLYVMHWLLSVMIDTSATGILTACAAIAGLANPFLQGIGNYLAPRFADTVSSGSRQQTMRLYWRTTALLAVVVTLFTAVAVCFGQELLWLFYRDSAYAGFGLVVGLLAVRLAFAIPTIAADHAVVAMECPRGSAAATFSGLVVTVCLAIPMIHLQGVIGAAIALLIGTGVESVVLLAVFVRYLRIWKWQDDT